MSKPPKGHLRIVETTARPVAHEPEAFESPQGERSLFVTQDPNMLIFVDIASVDEAEFLSLVISSKPKRIIDLRLVPRFDIGNLNRKLVFSVFNKEASTYHDLGAMIGSPRMREVAASPEASARAILESVFQPGRPVEGPIALLIDTRYANPEFIDDFAAKLDHVITGGWRTLRVPAVHKSAIAGNRSVVFISHATPNDNAFAQWLSTQLTLSGYDVWTDFERLEGGELFWDTIEDIIRNRAAKVIVAASRLAQTRSGVLDEVALALSVERSLGLQNFVIPLRIDDIPFSDFRANIARRNILDFQGNWASGLTSLLKVLEADRVPMEAKNGLANIGKIIHERLRTKKGLLDVADPVSVNWVQVRKWPPAIHAISLPLPTLKVGAHARTSQIPNVQFGDVLISFANPNAFAVALGGVGASSAGSVATSEFMKGRWNQFPSLRPGVARRMISNLVRQGWERTAREKGLLPFSLSSHANCWFLANGRLEGNKASFRDWEGKKRSKALVGYSQKRAVYWHFAAELRPLANHPETLVVKPHVVFSEDGVTPIASAARMHVLRRGFCKSWWNDRWRDLIAAFLSYVANGNDEFDLDVGGSEIAVGSFMSRLECPVSPDESEELVLLDELSSEEEDDPEIDEEELGFVLQTDAPGDDL